MNRRELFLVGTTTAITQALWTTVGGCGAQSTPVQHGGTTPPAAAHDELARLAAECLAACEACHAHCLRILATGDASMATCSRTTHECAALCRAMVTLASADAEHLRGLAAVCAQACASCHEACSAHAGHHAECARCAEACQRCGEACGALAA
jgi:Cys-rich four helix bundle protein (predicted Tat secretion target)